MQTDYKMFVVVAVYIRVQTIATVRDQRARLLFFCKIYLSNLFHFQIECPFEDIQTKSTTIALDMVSWNARLLILELETRISVCVCVLYFFFKEKTQNDQRAVFMSIQTIVIRLHKFEG